MSNNGLDKIKNKVFINPKFNRQSSSLNNYSNSATKMHVNPRFSIHLANDVSNLQHNKTKIFVNPEFMKSKSTIENIHTITSTNINEHNKLNNPNKLIDMSWSTIESKGLDVSVPIAKSRYCLVRQNHATTILENPNKDKIKHTFQVNKYKSIPVQDLKQKLDNALASANKPYHNKNYNNATDKKIISKAPSNYGVNKNQFKLVNHHITPMVTSEKVNGKPFILKKIQSSQPIIKKVKGSLKKNNIPCPMFRKFGRCLRQNYGNCEFLHDKKHVSVCRKFIKGLCHDKDCLLSHDLTSKKMPTCYFYLQGTCTKPDCPYLHVKLNEKVKICPDFVRGYCEKGSNCLLRHIYVGVTSGKVTSTQKVNIASVTRSSLKRKHSKIKTVDNKHFEDTKTCDSQTSGSSEHRYYQDDKVDVDAAGTCEMIKPTRCKLGTLPSFIQL